MSEIEREEEKARGTCQEAWESTEVERKAYDAAQKTLDEAVDAHRDAYEIWEASSEECKAYYAAVEAMEVARLAFEAAWQSSRKR